MIIKEITEVLEALAPLENAEDFDNVGLLVGDANTEVSGVLVTLDALEEVVEEAVSRNCNLIVSFHPIIFKGLRSLTGKTYIERAVIKAIQNNIAIYSMHTALDNSPLGVNARICEVLELSEPKILIPKEGVIKKLSTYIPVAEAEMLRQALFEAGAGQIGPYSHCSFTLEGTGSFKGGQNSNPAKGKKGKLHYEEEALIHVTFPRAAEKRVLKALFSNHPYEEVAYEIYTLDNSHQYLGMGMIGALEKPLTEEELISHVKTRMNITVVKHSKPLGGKVTEVAVLGGSGAFAIGAAKNEGADVFITSDIKYHQFFEAENQLLLLDIGHYESEQFTKNLLVDYLKKKIPNFAISLSETITNPINYS